MTNCNLKNKLIWLNGSSTGIGYATAQHLAHKGASLIVTARSAQKLEQAKDNLLKCGAHSVDILEYNITDRLEEGALTKILAGRKLDGVLLNAGGPKSGKLTSLDYIDFVAANELLVAGPARFLQTVLKHLANPSSIVAITSTSVKEPVGELNLSAIYRSAFTVMLKNLSRELGEQNIRINTVAPGKINTEHLQNMMSVAAQKKSTSVDHEKKQMSQCSALNRMGSPEEVASVISFLFSEESSFVNGQTIAVDGNSTLGYF